MKRNELQMKYAIKSNIVPSSSKADMEIDRYYIYLLNAVNNVGKNWTKLPIHSFQGITIERAGNFMEIYIPLGFLEGWIPEL